MVPSFGSQRPRNAVWTILLKLLGIFLENSANTRFRSVIVLMHDLTRFTWSRDTPLSSLEAFNVLFTKLDSVEIAFFYKILAESHAPLIGRYKWSIFLKLFKWLSFWIYFRWLYVFQIWRMWMWMTPFNFFQLSIIAGKNNLFSEHWLSRRIFLINHSQVIVNLI